jgi:biofilm PGA synthesis protein PgaD
MEKSTLPRGSTRDGARRTPRSAGPLIIEADWAQSRRQRRVSRALLATGWLAWAALWLPLLTVLAWLFFGTQLLLPTWLGLQTPSTQVLPPFEVGSILAAALALWMLYERIRHGPRRNRRVRTPTVAPAELAHDVRLSEKSLRTCWKRRRVVVHHDEHGVPVVFEATHRVKRLRRRDS